MTLTGDRIREEEIGILAKIKFLVLDDSGFEITNRNRSPASNVDRVVVRRASEFEADRHGRVSGEFNCKLCFLE